MAKTKVRSSSRRDPPVRHAITDAWSLVRESVVAFLNDNALSHGAAMAFYAATSLAPILLIVVAIAGLAFGHDAAQVALSAQISGLMGPESADLLQVALQGASSKSAGALATVIGVVTLLVTASGVFGEIQLSLNAIWKVEPKGTSLSRLVRARAASLGLVAALGLLLLISLVASAAISALGDMLNAYLPFGETILAVINGARLLRPHRFDVRCHLQGSARSKPGMARRGCRRHCDGCPLHPREIADRLVYRHQCRCIVIWGRRRAPRHPALGLLLVGDIPPRGRVHPRIFGSTWKPVRLGAAVAFKRSGIRAIQTAGSTINLALRFSVDGHASPRLVVPRSLGQAQPLTENESRHYVGASSDARITSQSGWFGQDRVSMQLRIAFASPIREQASMTEHAGGSTCSPHKHMRFRRKSRGPTRAPTNSQDTTDVAARGAFGFRFPTFGAAAGFAAAAAAARQLRQRRAWCGR